MNKLKLLGLFVGGLVLGAIATGWWSGHVYSRLIVSKEVDAAFRAAEEAEWLALLRLNEPKSVIEQLQKSMDVTVLTLAQWDEVKAPDEKTRKARDRFLVPVKVYHESYPPSGNDAARIKSLLTTIPGRNPQSICKNGVCLLDDLHRRREREHQLYNKMRPNKSLQATPVGPGFAFLPIL